jgi:hypothetical protein
MLKPARDRAGDVGLITGAQLGYERYKLVKAPTYEAFRGATPDARPLDRCQPAHP